VLRSAGVALYRQDYAAAGRLAASRFSRDREDPTGLLIQANTVRMLIYDSGDPAMADSFYRLCDRLERECRDRLDQRPDDAWTRFCLGTGMLNRAEMLGWQQQYWGALLKTAAVPALLDQALDLEPDLTDCRLGLGVVEFFKAQSKRYTLGLPLFGSTRRAFQLVGEAATGDGALTDAAWFTLAFMAKQDGRPAEAVRRCEALLLRYPGNRAAMRLLRDALYDAGDFRRTLDIGGEIEQSIKASYPANLYGLTENWLKCGKARLKLGEKRAAAVEFRRIIGYESRVDDVPWLRNYVAEARGLLKKAQ
jgi:tetratricopeptide (TPR) repeat protein